jgi:hypothetical protein
MPSKELGLSLGLSCSTRAAPKNPAPKAQKKQKTPIAARNLGRHGSLIVQTWRCT